MMDDQVKSTHADHLQHKDILCALSGIKKTQVAMLKSTHAGHLQHKEFLCALSGIKNYEKTVYILRMCIFEYFPFRPG
jgi:hypothetical protein